MRSVFWGLWPQKTPGSHDFLKTLIGLSGTRFAGEHGGILGTVEATGTLCKLQDHVPPAVSVRVLNTTSDRRRLRRLCLVAVLVVILSGLDFIPADVLIAGRCVGITPYKAGTLV